MLRSPGTSTRTKGALDQREVQHHLREAGNRKRDHLDQAAAECPREPGTARHHRQHHQQGAHLDQGGDS